MVMENHDWTRQDHNITTYNNHFMTALDYLEMETVLNLHNDMDVVVMNISDRAPVLCMWWQSPSPKAQTTAASKEKKISHSMTFWVSLCPNKGS